MVTLVIKAIYSLVLVVIVYVFLYIALYKIPWIGEWLLNKGREWAGMPLENMGLLLRLDENSGDQPGTKVPDSSGWNNHGTFGTYPPTWGAGTATTIWSGSLVFDGVDDYLEVGKDAKSPERLNPSNITIDFWFKLLSPPDPGCWRNIMNKGTTDPSYQVILTDELLIIVRFKINGVEKSLKSNGFVGVKPSRGTHIAVTYDSSGMAKIFINGLEDKKEKIDPGGIDSNTNPLRIGNLNDNPSPCPTSGGPPNAVIDEIRIYDRALSNEEIISHYQNLY